MSVFGVVYKRLSGRVSWLRIEAYIYLAALGGGISIFRHNKQAYNKLITILKLNIRKC